MLELSKCIILLIFIDLSYSEHEGTEMLAVFTYANELGLEPGLNSPEFVGNNYLAYCTILLYH